MFLIMKTRNETSEGLETLAEAAGRLLARLDARREREKASEGLNAPRNFQNTRKPQWVGEDRTEVCFPRRLRPVDQARHGKAEGAMRIRVAANCNRRVHLRPHLGYGSE